RYLADRLVIIIGYIESAVPSHGNARRRIESRQAAGPIFVTTTRGPSQSAHYPGRVNATYRIVIGVRHINKTAAAHPYASGFIKPRDATSAIHTSRRRRRRRPSQSSNDPRGRDLPNRVVLGIRYIDEGTP